MGTETAAAGGPGRTVAAPLLERERELDELAACLADAREGTGRLVVVEGSAGIGKTRLVAAARERARADGFQVLDASGGELERDFPFGVVRQLFEPALRAIGPDERDAVTGGAAGLAAGLFASAADLPEYPSGESFGPMLHGLYWLTVNLSAAGPLLIAVDDTHWCDAPSLRFLDYLARRLDGLPVLLLVATRPAAPEEGAASLAALSAEPAAAVLRPPALSRNAVTALVRERLAPDADPRFCGACHSATGGNPFLAGELLAELAAGDVVPTADAAARVESLGPSAVARSVNLRLARLPSEALALARAAAILGEHAGLRRAAAITGLDVTEAARTADALARAGVFATGGGLRFTHSIVRAAIYAELPPGERALTHDAAARALAAENAPIAEVAAHLLAGEPAGDPWVVEVLSAAARQALAQGAPDPAVAQLTRALAEPPPPAARPGLLAELGRAEAQALVPAAIEHLTEALALTTDPAERGRVALDLGRALTHSDRLREAVDVLDRARAEVEPVDSELAMRLDAELISAARLDLSTRGVGRERLERVGAIDLPDTPAGRALLAHLAFEAVVAGHPVEDAAAHAERAMAGGRLLAEEGANGPPFYMGTWALSACDRVESAERWLDDAQRLARETGSALGFANFSCFKAHAAMRRGALAVAEANARTALELGREHGWRIGLPMSMAVLVNALIERGEVAEANLELAAAEIEADSSSMSFAVLMFSRGRLRALGGDVHGALEDLLGSGRRAVAWGSRTPTFFPWRSTAALLLNATGERAEAERLLAEELSMARAFGAPTPIGLALSATGLMQDGDEGLAALREAIAVLDRSPALLARARARTWLGIKLRAGGDPRGARDPLRAALDLAHRCGATPLAEQARAELVAAGGRPRRAALSGSAALTPSELRVATMAADGLTNSEVAQALFVTPRTVEQHLSNAYRKLGISSRGELPDAL